MGPPSRGRASTPRSSSSTLKHSSPALKTLELYQTHNPTILSEGFASHFVGAPRLHIMWCLKTLHAPLTTVLPQLCSLSFIWDWTRSSNRGPRVSAFCPSANHALPTPPLRYPLGTQRTFYGHRAPKETIVSFLKLRYRGYTAFFDLLKAGQPPSSRLWNLKSLICIILTLFFTSPILSQT